MVKLLTIISFKTIKKLKLQKFSNLKSNVSIKLKNREISLNSLMNLFGQLPIIIQTRQINLKDVFCYPLSIYPLALATNIGFIHKTNKASLLQSLEKNVQPGVIRQDTTNIVNVLDGMTLIRKMKLRDITFSQLAKQIFQHVLNITPRPVRTDLVFDIYKEKWG